MACKMMHWPQDRISREPFAVLSMDLTAPFISDMGLHVLDIEPLRASARTCIESDPRMLRGGSRDDKLWWLGLFEQALTDRAGSQSFEEFCRWISETYTYAPADRPNWEAYEMFFFEWSVHMRDGEDTAACFVDPDAVYEAYYGFVPSRRIDVRIKESRSRTLSTWDQHVFSLVGYTLVEDSENEEDFDPFAAVEATATRFYFQQFWEYLLERLSKEEESTLWQALRRHYDGQSWAQNTVSPRALTRNVF